MSEHWLPLGELRTRGSKRGKVVLFLDLHTVLSLWRCIGWAAHLWYMYFSTCMLYFKSKPISYLGNSHRFCNKELTVLSSQFTPLPPPISFTNFSCLRRPPLLLSPLLPLKAANLLVLKVPPPSNLPYPEFAVSTPSGKGRETAFKNLNSSLSNKQMEKDFWSLCCSEKRTETRRGKKRHF